MQHQYALDSCLYPCYDFCKKNLIFKEAHYGLSTSC